ncbi:DUF262 domain-containing protein [Segatella bryantii]|uniref:DUF262 domain-containing protein n=1 Tax=Segatella bryantii TaxID=77095 RepID=UPI00242ABD72|nr:DUF262 domain-containing protein [Segatella bryantii]
MSHIANKIVAQDKALHSVFSETRYRIDTFQREYRWQYKQIEALISDLTGSFLSNYESSHDLSYIDSYDCYYMGPIVLCEDGAEMSVVDGQQRLTSFLLLLVYLRHLQKKYSFSDVEYKELDNYIYVSKGGKKTFCLDVPSRNIVMKKLYGMNSEMLDFSLDFESSKDKESLENLLICYDVISHIFPEEINNAKVLPLFIEWLLYRVVLVEIKAFSVDNAYTIFETMNDRGLSLNPTEILKAFVLSKITSEPRAEEMNDFWKQRISEIKYRAGSEGDLLFFRAWFRAKFAQNISKGRAGDEKMDFEQIGAQFHTWFKNNHSKLIHLKNSDDFYYFVKADFDFYSRVFNQIIKSNHIEGEEINPFYITASYPMADSLYLPLMLSSLLATDSQILIKEKLLVVNKFADYFVNIRTLQGKSVNQSGIRRKVFEIIKKIRNTDIETLKEILAEEMLLMGEKTDLVSGQFSFSQNYSHYFFARILFFLHKEDYFAELLRSRRHKSYVLIQIFTEDQWDELKIGDGKITCWSLMNYCLCRRNEINDVPTIPEERIKWLIDHDYLLELQNEKYTLQDFCQIRFQMLNRIAKEIWCIDNIYNSNTSTSFEISLFE